MLYKKLTPLLFLIFLLTVVISCKKTGSLPTQPQNRILQYKVTNLQDTVIYGAINDSSRTITVYLPFYLNLQVIDPDILLFPGATIQNSILPVAVSDTTTTYTIKGKDGSTATYKLSIIVQSLPLVLQELSSPASIATRPANGFILDIVGNFNTLDLSAFSMSLLSASSAKSYPMTVVQAYTRVSISDGVYYLSQPHIPADIDTGLYRVKITMFGQNTATMVYPIRVYYPGPDILPLYTAAPKQGETFTLSANYSAVLRGLVSFSLLVNGTYQPLTIQSFTNGSATILVPDNFPPGTYNNFQLVCDGYDPLIYANGTRGSITVLPR